MLEQTAEIVYSPTIRRENAITDRTLRKWVKLGKFPTPSGNLNGRNFWTQAAYVAWKSDVAAGKYSMQRRIGGHAPAKANAPAGESA